jgi:hypothetical protein
MSSMLRMSEQELRAQTAGQGVRAASGFGLAVVSTVLALLGMVARYSPGDTVPLPGMDHAMGQAAWAALLGSMMLIAATLMQNVVVRRLQVALVVSLAVHLIICLLMQNIAVNMPSVVSLEVADQAGTTANQLTLPDYGGMESPQAEPVEWDRPSDVSLDSQMQDVQRQAAEAPDAAEPTPADIERPQQEVARLENLQRQQQEVMRQEQQLEIERQQQAAQAEAPQTLDRPEVTTQENRQAQLEAREMQRQAAEARVTERAMTEVETQTETRVESVKTERAEVRPQEMARQEFESAQRSAAAAGPVEARAEAVEVARAAASQQVTTEAQQLEAARQADASLPTRESSPSESPQSEREMLIASLSPARAAASVALPSNVSPTEAARLERSTTAASRKIAAAQANAQSVDVAAAAASNAPALNASSASAATARSTAANVPTTAGRQQQVPSSSGSTQAAVTSLTAGTIGRQQSTGASAQLGPAASNPPQGRTSGGSASASIGAVGTQAESVAVSGAASSPSAGRGVLASGPSATGVSRNPTGLPATGSSSGGSGTPGGASSPGGGSGLSSPSGSRALASAIRGSSGTGLASRATEPTARLGAVVGLGSGGSTGGSGNTGSSSTGSSSTGNSPTGSSSTGNSPTGSSIAGPRRMAAASLPSGALEAEASGALVMTGPRAEASFGTGSSGLSGGGLSGPRVASLPRRSAGLPGLGPTGSATVGRSRPGLPGGLSASRLPARTTGEGTRPSLASPSQIAGLIRRSVPGAAAAPEARINAGFSMRRPDVRSEAVQTLGGSEESEDAVERGLTWLATHQYAAGNWSVHDLNCVDHDCGGAGDIHSDTAATGLSLLAFLGAGYTHKAGKHQDVVQRGIDWLLAHQKPDGDLFADESEFVWLYSHGMASIALCEAYGMTGDERLKEPAQKCLDFIVAAQHPRFGGWRYRPQFESDTSVSGWQLMALKSGEMAGLTVPQSVYSGVSHWLTIVEDKSAPGRFAYHPSERPSLAMTAEGLLMRQYLGATRDDAALKSGADYLRARLPRAEERDAYYWYYGTQVMFHMQGEYWEEWNAALREPLIDAQLKDGPLSGSWSPERPTRSKWGAAGGRHYLTCLNILMLEVYYRHLPLYIELNHSK